MRQFVARNLARVAPAYVTLCVLVAFAVFGLGIQIVDTESVPLGVYRRFRLGDRPLRRGDYVCLEGWRAGTPALLSAAVEQGAVPASWGRSERLTKRVAAITGDRVDYMNEHVTVNGVPLPRSTALFATSKGVALPKASYPVVLATEEVWLSSEHARGFDSRYFGPVKRAALSCRAQLVWRW